MNILNHIAFFWVGPDVTIPAMLVRSIRAAFGPNFNVHQLSNRETPTVDGVTTHKKLKLSPHIMVARLEAYAATGHGDVKKLKGSRNEYRLRMGDYRALFELEGRTATVYAVGDRKEIYR